MTTDLIISSRLEEIAIKIDAHGKAAIENILTIGKLLCEARQEEFGENDKFFGQWREKRLPWLKQKMAYRWMNAYQNGGENLLGQNVRVSVLYELTAPDVPEAAREEAQEHESLTVKQSKELVKAHKELAELQAENTRLKEDKKTPEPANTNHLIPGIKEMLDDGRIMPAMAKKISTMTDEGQQAWLTLQVQKLSLENQLKEKTYKIKELESRPDPEPKIIEKEVIPLDVQDKLKKAETALAKLKKAENERRSINDAYNGISQEKHSLEYEISKLQEQLKVNDPANIDAAHAEAFNDILDMIKNRLIRFEEDRKVTDYPMNKTWEVLNETMESLSAFSDRAENLVCINPIGELNHV